MIHLRGLRKCGLHGTGLDVGEVDGATNLNTAQLKQLTDDTMFT